MRKNLYQPKTQEEILKEQFAKKELDAKLQGVVEVLRRCIDSPDFKDYKKRYFEAQREIEDLMMRHADPDPVQDAYFMRACLNKLSILRLLLDAVQTDVKKRLK